MAKIKSANGTIWKVQDVYIDKEDKTWVTKNLFIKKGEDWEFCNYLYTDMEYTDLVDTVSVLDNNNTFEFIEICPDIVEEVYHEFLETNLASKILPFILFAKMEDVMPFIMGVSDPRILSVINWRKMLDSKGVTIGDFVEDKVIKEHKNYLERIKSAIDEVELEEK